MTGKEELLSRFWPKVNRDKQNPNGCWEWTAALSEKGYGRFWDGVKTGKAHRFAYELFVGPIPEGLQLDHLCRNRACVNPAHMEAVTARENTLRSKAITAENARKTHCPQGHPYSGENLMVCKATGERRCRICRLATFEKYNKARRVAA